MDPETNSRANRKILQWLLALHIILTIGTNTPSTRNFLIGVNVTF